MCSKKSWIKNKYLEMIELKMKICDSKIYESKIYKSKMIIFGLIMKIFGLKMKMKIILGNN